MVCAEGIVHPTREGTQSHYEISVVRWSVLKVSCSQRRREHNVTMNQCGVVVCAEGIVQPTQEGAVSMIQCGII